MASLSDDEVDKIERINDSFARREEAAAAREAQQKMRVLFERTAQDALPFVVYVVYMGAMGLLVVFKLLEVEGTRLWLGTGLLTLVMLAPLFILPRASWGWLRGRIGRTPMRGDEPALHPSTPGHARTEGE